MSQAWTVARREIRGYFDYPTAYILVIAFLALGLFLTMRAVLSEHVATMRPLFDLLPWLFAVFVPAITMRSLAEERRSHTLEWLLAQPLDEVDVLVGKFLGNWIFVLVALAGTVPTAIGILAASHSDPGITLAQYIGASLLAAQFVAVGLWASSVTRNQITAFILATSVSLVLVLIGMDVVTIGLPPLLGGVVARLSVVPHFENVARGVVDFRDVLYFVSTAAFFLVLAGFALARERLSHTRGAYRRLRLGAIGVAAAVVLVNLLGGYIGGRLDLTRDRLFTLSPGTRDLERSLKDVVQIKLYVSKQLPPEFQLALRDVRDLLGDMARASHGNLQVIERDPDSDEDIAREARSYGVQQVRFSVQRDNALQVQQGWFGLAVTYANASRDIPSIDRTDDLEFRLASFIASLTGGAKPKVAFMMGFGAGTPNDYQLLQDAIGEQYQVTSVEVPGQVLALSPDSFRVAILAAPREHVDTLTIQRMNAFLKAGGSLLVLVDNIDLNSQAGRPEPVDHGLAPFLAEHGVGLGSGLVFDLNQYAIVAGPGGAPSPYPLAPFGVPAGDHITTHDLHRLSVAFTAPLTVLDPQHVQPLWQSSTRAGVRAVTDGIDMESFHAPPADSLHRQVLAVAVDPGLTPGAGIAGATHGTGRMIVVGDALFLRDGQLVQSNPQNLTFAANAIDWLAQDEKLIRIRSKQRTPPPLSFTSDLTASVFKWGNLIGVPLLFIVYGAIRIVGRGHRARLRWKTGDANGGTAA